MPILAMAIGAGAGLLKSELVDRPKENRQRKLAAATQRYSPWTGLQAGQISEADPMGSAIAFGATGAQIGTGMEQHALNQKLGEKALANSSVPNYNAGPTQANAMAQQPYWMNDPYGNKSPWGAMGYGG